MKNLDFALHVLQQVQAPICFDIYGYVDDEAYWKQCQKLIESVPKNVEVTYEGHIAHESVHATLAAYDLFFLPTRGENYGHVIHEALVAGTPVLISDRTPWRDLANRNVGWDISLDSPNQFCSAIEGLSSATNEAMRAMRRAASNFGHEVSMASKTVEANVALFEKALSSHGQRARQRPGG